MKSWNNSNGKIERPAVGAKDVDKKIAVTHRACTALRGKRIGDEQGNLLVELALVLPLFMLLITGIFSYAFAFYNQLTLTQAVGAGGQFIQTNRTSTSDPCKDTMSVITNSAPSLTASNIALTINFNGTKVTGNTCTGSVSSLLNAQNEPVTVSATYPCNLKIFSMTIAPGCQLAAQVTEYEY